MFIMVSNFGLFYLTIHWIVALGVPTAQQSVSAPGPAGRPDATVRTCELGPNERWLTVLPGVGWDNLVNEERGPTIDRERYDKCRRSTDGRFLIPDDVLVEPRKHSQLDLTSDVFESTSQCTSLTAYSINSAVDFGASYYRINGDFSFEKESLRNNAGTSKGLIVRTQLRHTRYTIQIMPDSTLEPRLRNRLLDIAAHLESGNVTIEHIDQFDKGNLIPVHVRSNPTRLDENQLIAMEAGMKAFYLADLIVRDYGTHSISSVDAGGVLVKTDILNEDTSMLTKEDRWKVAASASTTFASMLKLNIGGSMSTNQSVAQRYNRQNTHSRVNSFGGPIFRAYQMNLSDWEQGLDDQLVAIDRSGQPIHELITGRSMPELAEHVILRLSKTIKSAVERYYKSNAVIGCMNPNSAFYDNNANVDAEMCSSTDQDQEAHESDPLPLGGVFQKCDGPSELCAMVAVKNPATGDFTCPQGYLAIQLLPPQVRSCISACHPSSTWSGTSQCEQQCAVTVQYWCALDPSLTVLPHAREDVGLVFGGLYTNKEVNPITHQFNCPEYSWPLVMGRHIRICLSTDRELASKRAMRFGGFYSCQYGNPIVTLLSANQTKPESRGALRSWLNATVQMEQRSGSRATNHTVHGLGRAGGSLENTGNQATMDYSVLFATLWPKRCPDGYTAHLAAMEDTCQVTFCVPANTIIGTRKRYLKRPPFVLPPALMDDDELEARSKLFRSVFSFSLGSNNFGLDTDYHKAPIRVSGSEGSQLTRVDGIWIRSQPDQFVTSDQLRHQKEISIALGSAFAVIVVIVISLGIAVVLGRRKFLRGSAQIGL
uniref:Macrophage expressed protein-like protein n=1 Tax=Himasthla elongata TaxID=1175217 RepID=A0A165X530_9TREM|nr:macrophage expressed protein-like protein [Himasthla elongata]